MICNVSEIPAAECGLLPLEVYTFVYTQHSTFLHCVCLMVFKVAKEACYSIESHKDVPFSAC